MTDFLNLRDGLLLATRHELGAIVAIGGESVRLTTAERRKLGAWLCAEPVVELDAGRQQRWCACRGSEPDCLVCDGCGVVEP